MKKKLKVDIAYLASLLQMKVTQAEEKELQKGFQETLKTIKVFDKLNTEGINPNFQVTGLTNIFRQDKVDRTRILTQKQALSNAKITFKGYFVVPRIIHET